MNAIEASDLRKAYDDVQALDGLSFSVKRGTVFGLLGPNGAGKSTTVKILTTLSRPDSGTALRDGPRRARRPGRGPRGDRRRRSAQRRRHPGDRAREPAPAGPAVRALGAALEPRIDELLGQFGLADAADRLVRTYSGGMQRRLDVAIALVHGPQVLFLDEPTTGLDPEVRADMWDEIGGWPATRG